MKTLQKWLAAVAFTILAYCSVVLLFVVYQHGVDVGESGWQASPSDPCDGRSCERLHDLTNDYPYSPLDGTTDMLEEMRACGLKPRLLTRAVPRSESSLLVVPNVIHYIRYSNNASFDFQHYLSYLGVQRFIKPRYIFLHGDALPDSDNEWWKRTLGEVDNLYHVYREMPTEVHGTPIEFIQHSADITRLAVLIDYGGIYIDDDVLIVKSFDDLRVFDLTLGRPVAIALSNGIIIARKGALFLRLWLENYRNYSPKSWGGNSVAKGNIIHKVFPHLVHVEEQSLLHPSWQESPAMFSRRIHYNWTGHYSIHIYFESTHHIPKNPEQLKSYENTLGQVMRYIYYGSSDLIPVSGTPFVP